MEDILGVLVAVIVVSIPLVAVAGKVIIQPLIAVLNRLVDQRAALDETLPGRVRELEVRIESLERTTKPALDEIEFRRRLEESRSERPS